MTAQVIQCYDRDGRPAGGLPEAVAGAAGPGRSRGLRIHDLRHSFASYALSGGQTLGVVGQLLGHRSTQTTSRYAHLVDEAARAAVARVSDDLGV